MCDTLSINDIIQNALNEYNGCDGSFFDDTCSDVNIFNKEIVIPEEVYNKILGGEAVHEFEIKYLSNIVNAVNVSCNKDLRKIIMFYSDNYPEESLNWLDITGIDDFHHMFYNTKYNGDISMWDVSNATNIYGMFMRSAFNNDISNWNISNATDLSYMFKNSAFNGDISRWDVSNVTSMYYMFYESQFNGDISKWNTSKVTNMQSMFMRSAFNCDISDWDVSNVMDMDFMFYESLFNHDISKWDVSNVKYYKHMLMHCYIKDEYIPVKFINKIYA